MRINCFFAKKKPHAAGVMISYSVRHIGFALLLIWRNRRVDNLAADYPLPPLAH